MTMRKTSTIGLLTVALLLAACDAWYLEAGPRSYCRTGHSSVKSSKTVTLDAFDAVDMAGDGRLEIRVGDAESSLTLEGTDAALRRTRAEVRGGRLYIRTPGSRVLLLGARFSPLTVRIGVPHLAALRLRGGTDVSVEGFQGGESAIRVSGAAHIQAAGRLQKLVVHMSGAGHADLNDLIVDRVRVTVDGVGSVHVHARDSLDATMNGVGAILYRGNPSDVKTRMNGLGSIGRQESGHHPDEYGDLSRRAPDATPPDDTRWSRETPGEVI